MCIYICVCVRNLKPSDYTTLIKGDKEPEIQERLLANMWKLEPGPLSMVMGRCAGGRGGMCNGTNRNLALPNLNTRGVLETACIHTEILSSHTAQRYAFHTM